MLKKARFAVVAAFALVACEPAQPITEVSPAKPQASVAETAPPAPTPQPSETPPPPAPASKRAEAPSPDCGDIEPLRYGGTSSTILPPRLVKRVEPVTAHAGILIIETIIDATGRVCDARLIGPTGEGEAGRQFAEDGVVAVRQWTFEPATLAGVPVPVFHNVTLSVPYPTSR